MLKVSLFAIFEVSGQISTTVDISIVLTNFLVFISSQPESIDLDNESNSSVDASLINELIENVGGTMASENR